MQKDSLPLIQLAAPFFDDVDIDAIVAVLRSGTLAQGPQISGLENETSALLGGVPAVAVANGSAALYLAGRALDLQPGNIVLVSALTYAASANAFTFAGCRVVPVDVSPDTMNMEEADLRAALSEHPDARCAVVVDLYGSTAGTDLCISAAREHGVTVIEDACQAHGAGCAGGSAIGPRADATTLSFYATKNVAAGEGGLVATPDPDVADRVRMLRNHGSHDAVHFSDASLNFRMTEVGAALARRQLLNLGERNAHRLANARRIAAAFVAAWGDRVRVPTVPGDGTHVFHHFTVRFGAQDERDACAARLGDAGIQTKVFYPYTVGELPGVAHRPTPAAERLRDTVLSVPVHPRLDEESLTRMEAAIAGAAARGS